MIWFGVFFGLILANFPQQLQKSNTVQVVGKNEPIKIFELIGKKDALDENILRLKKQFEKALQAYRSEDWSQARQKKTGTELGA